MIRSAAKGDSTPYSCAVVELLVNSNSDSLGRGCRGAINSVNPFVFTVGYTDQVELSVGESAAERGEARVAAKRIPPVNLSADQGLCSSVRQRIGKASKVSELCRRWVLEAITNCRFDAALFSGSQRGHFTLRILRCASGHKANACGNNNHFQILHGFHPISNLIDAFSVQRFCLIGPVALVTSFLAGFAVGLCVGAAVLP